MKKEIKTIALLTDFGIKDHYAGVVKGRILKELKKDCLVNFIDITHEIPPQDVRKACLTLYFSYKYFPENTVFLVIVDPGVGTERKGILIKTEKYFFIGPDNGVFSLVIKECLKNRIQVECFYINDKVLLKPPYSSTFHGRDLFAPAVSFLLEKGIEKRVFIKLPLKDLKKLDFPEPEKTQNGFRLSVWYIDVFGNLITNFHRNLVDKDFRVIVNKQEVPLVKSYGYEEEGKVIALFGSEGLLEIAVNKGSAYKKLGIPEIEVIWK